MNHSIEILCMLACLFGSFVSGSVGWFVDTNDHEDQGHDLKSQIDELASNQHYMANFQDPELAKDMLKMFNLKCLKTKITDEIAAIDTNEFECVQEKAFTAIKSLNATDFHCFRNRSIDLISKMDEKCYKSKLIEQISQQSELKLSKFLTVMFECFDPSVLSLLKYDCLNKIKSIGMEILYSCVKKTKAPIINMFIDCMDFNDNDNDNNNVENVEYNLPKVQDDDKADVSKVLNVPIEVPSRFKTPVCLNNSNCQDVNTWESYCCDDLKKCCDLLKYTFKDSNRLYNFLVVYREPRTVYTTVMYGLPVLSLFLIACGAILLSDLYSFCHYLFCRRCIDCVLKRRQRNKKACNERYFHISRDVSHSALLENSSNRSNDQTSGSNI